MRARPLGIVPILAPEDVVPIPGAAPAAPSAQLTYHGGHLLSAVEVFTIFWGTAWQQPAQSGLVTGMNGFFDFMLRSALLDLLGEYSVPGQTIFSGTRTGTITITDTEPGDGTQVSDVQIRAALQQWTDTGRIPSPNGNTLYFVFLPPGVTSLLGTAQSCAAPPTGFCGYHSSTGALFYGVLVYVSCSGCGFAGTGLFDTLTKVCSHELCEAITNPNNGGWWDDSTLNEIGDICNSLVYRLGPYWIQTEWSNRESRCVGPAANQQHVFYRDTTGSIQHIFWDAPTSKLFTDNWTARAKTALPAAGDPATMVVPDQQHVFYRDSNGSIQHIFWDAANNGIFTDNWTLRVGAAAAAGNPGTLKIFATN